MQPAAGVPAAVRTCVYVISSSVVNGKVTTVLHGVPATQHAVKTNEDLCDVHAALYTTAPASRPCASTPTISVPIKATLTKIV